ncbi:acyltransferase domain-containing protein [Kitasatospora cineracea]|uniref:acyl-CoA dehydrogenase family protein n=1 Tax=Kitasatospora cineracea TaxID=88074 RepID=UPI000F4862E9|nr:acyltransferase domain-containing protein [Kitasatospora cineracea]
MQVLSRAAARDGALRRALRAVYEEIDASAGAGALPSPAALLLGADPPGGRELARGPVGLQQVAHYGAAVAWQRVLAARYGPPDALLAVSFGELAALTAAGAWTVGAGARAAYGLAGVLARTPGGLTLIGCGEARAAELAARAGGGRVAVGCVNSPRECVLGGPPDRLAAVEGLAAAEGLSAVRLHLPFGSHHPELGRQRGEFEEVLRDGPPIGPTAVPVYSAVAGRRYTPADDLAARVADCLVRPAHLPRVLALLAAHGHTDYREAGPGSALGRNAADCLRGTGARVHATGEEDSERGPRTVTTDRTLDELLHGRHHPGRLPRLHRALARYPYRVAEAAAEREPYLYRRLRALLRALPAAADLHADPDGLAAALAWAAVADPRLGMTVVTQSVLGQGSLLRLAGARKGVAPELGAVDAGDLRIGYLVTEAGRASSHLGAGTVAEFRPERREFVLRTAEEADVKFGGVPQYPGPRGAVVIARAVDAAGRAGGVFAFLVRLADHDGPRPGVALSPPVPVGALPLSYHRVRFDGVRVPEAHWLRDDADLDADGHLHDPRTPEDRLRRTLAVGQDLWGVLPTALAALARQSAVLAVRHSRHRETRAALAPGSPLLAHRSQQRALLGALADAFALSCAAARARELLAAARESDAAGAESGFAPWAAVSRPLSAYKAHCADEAERIIAECQRRCGHAGLADGNRLAGYHGFARSFDPAGGDSRLIRYDLGRALLAEAGPGGPPPVPADLGDPGWWPAVLARHQHTLTDWLRRATAERARGGATPFEVWNPLLDRAAELGAAYAARLAAEDLPRALAALPPDGATDALAHLAALRAADRTAGALLRHRTLAPGELAGLENALERGYDRLLPHLEQVERAFAFPDDIVLPEGSPDGFPEGFPDGPAREGRPEGPNAPSGRGFPE